MRMNRGNTTKVFVGMSGGVDSSVAAYLLKKQGYDVVGVFMHSFNLDGCEEKDAEDARRVAAHLNIPFYVMDFEDEYKKYVVEYMVRGYAAGLTPNPDVMCNKEIKFGFFLKKALEFGADYIATGHYVRLRRNFQIPISNIQLYEAKDKNKDQSYFLWTLTEDQLKRCLFPIGDYVKPTVRKIAKRAGLPTAAKKDSQGICFLGKVTLADFLKNYIPAKEGAVVNTEGEKIGVHRGVQLYTIGQRHGLCIRSKKQEAGSKEDRKPHYVADKNVETNTIVAVEGDAHPALCKKEVELREVNLISKKLPKIIYARVRYRQPVAKARIRNQESGIKLVFDTPQKYVAPGQSAVFYRARRTRRDGEGGCELLGGGVIA